MPLRKLLLAYIRSLMVKRELAIQRRGTLLCDRTIAKIPFFTKAFHGTRRRE